ncbi:MAG TPA: hypothetical protein VKR56_11810 [Candidatus Cybelea sp.]|nr:hypothetical protein [Candidatus Cybelea sp.]
MSDDKKNVPDRELDDLSGGRGIEGREPVTRGHEPEVVGHAKTPEFIERGRERE